MKPGSFSKLCLLACGLWLIVILPTLIWRNYQSTPGKEAENIHVDFFQYYAGAMVVRYGIWDALYPIPKPEVYRNPNQFIPRFKTFLFNPNLAHTELAFYPPVNLTQASDSAPKLLSYFPEQATHFRFIYPPPTALLLWPLSFLNFEAAANLVWPILSTWALFLMAYFASRIHRLFRDGESYTEGLILLACVLFSYRGQTHIAAGNITPILSALIAFAVFSLLRERLTAFSCAWIPLLLFKTLGLTWLPLLLINRRYWKNLLYLAIATLILNGIVIGLAGVGVYIAFFSLASKIVIPAGVGIVPGLLYSFGFYPHMLYMLINLATLGLLYYGYWKHGLRGNSGYALPCLVALLAGTMALFCLTNFTIYLAYCPCYLFFPFLGWILQEGYQATGIWRRVILGGTVLAFLVLACDWLVRDLMGHFMTPPKADIYFIILDRPFYIAIIPLFFLAVALRRLFFVGQGKYLGAVASAQSSDPVLTHTTSLRD